MCALKGASLRGPVVGLVRVVRWFVGALEAIRMGGTRPAVNQASGWSWLGEKRRSEVRDGWRIRCRVTRQFESLAYGTVSAMLRSHKGRVGRIPCSHEWCKSREDTRILSPFRERGVGWGVAGQVRSGGNV